MINLRKIQISNTEPSTDVLWLKDDTAKYFNNGQWITIGGGSQEEEQIKQLSNRVSTLETTITSQNEQIINLATVVKNVDDYNYINRVVRNLVNTMDCERGDVYTRYCLGFYKGRVSQETIIASTAELQYYIQLSSAEYLNGNSRHIMEDYYKVSPDGIPTINIGTAGTTNNAWYFETSNFCPFSFKSFGPTNCNLVGLRSSTKDTTQFNGYVGLGVPVSTGDKMTLMANFSAVVFPE